MLNCYAKLNYVSKFQKKLLKVGISNFKSFEKIRDRCAKLNYVSNIFFKVFEIPTFEEKRSLNCCAKFKLYFQIFAGPVVVAAQVIVLTGIIFIRPHADISVAAAPGGQTAQTPLGWQPLEIRVGASGLPWPQVKTN